MPASKSGCLADGAQCTVIANMHARKTGTVRDVKTTPWSLLLAVLSLLLAASSGCSNSNAPSPENIPKQVKDAVAFGNRPPSAGNPSEKDNDNSSAEGLYQQGSDAETRKDYAEAIKWYVKAAEAGSVKGMSSAGSLYREGVNGTKDYAEARKWYLNAAEAGDGLAMNDLGTMNEYGEGVPQDNSEAVSWYRKSADAGYPRGMYNLARMYHGGSGVSQDYVEAVKWYRKAADGGEPLAEPVLRKLSDYLAGAETKPDDTIPPCTVHHEGDGSGIPCINPYTGETTDFYTYKSEYRHDPGE